MTDSAVELETVEPVESAKPGQLAPVSDEQLVAMLVARARSEGLQLTGQGGLPQQLTERVLESALEGEITDHVGYEKHDPAGKNNSNSHNGTRSKTVLTDVGPVEVKVPRDTAGSFEPQIVKKRQRRLTGVDEIVLSLSAKGLKHGEISAHLAEVYGAQVSSAHRLGEAGGKGGQQFDGLAHVPVNGTEADAEPCGQLGVVCPHRRWARTSRACRPVPSRRHRVPRSRRRAVSFPARNRRAELDRSSPDG